MILSRFFKPKWQHSDPQIRKRSLAELSATDPVLIKIACEDHDPSVRLAALEKVSDIGLLRIRAQQDKDGSVRASAEKRFREIMTGATITGVSLEARLAAVDDGLPPDLLQFLVVHAKETEMRLAVLEQIKGNDTLVDRVINDPASEVQLAALAQLHETDILEQVARETRNRNKRIHRAVKERLATRQLAYEQQQRIAQFCARMEALAESGAGANDTRFRILEKEWAGVEAAADDELAQRYQRARERVVSRDQHKAVQRAAQREAYQSLEELLARLGSEVELTPDLAALIENTLVNKDAIEAEPVLTSNGKGGEQQIVGLQKAIRERERVLQREHERAQRLRQLLQQADKLVAQTKDVGEDDLSRLKKLWKSLERPETERLTMVLQAQFDAALDQLQARLQRQTEQQTQRFHDLCDMVTELEKTLGRGELQQAIALNDQVRQSLKKQTLPRGARATLGERLQACAATLGELRGWRRWGTYQAREHLCEDAESLIEGDDEPPIVAKRIQRLRTVWKSLDSAEGAASKVLWERFNNACERAYEPCQSFFEAQARERQTNLEKKQEFCQQLEELEANTDWENADWRAADRMRNEAHKHWRKTGPVNRGDRKEIERRYKAVSQRLDKRLRKQREYEVRRREALIQRVEELLASDDLTTAVEGAKQAQAEWQPTVLSSHRTEQELWQRFRAACDAIFERRQGEQDKVVSERQENLVRKTALCEEIEALAADGAQGWSESKIQEFRQIWSGIGHVPQGSYKDIERRFEAACQQLERRRRDQQQAETLAAIQSLRDRAKLCALIEGALIEMPTDIEAVVARAREQWSELPPVRKALKDAINERFDAICKAVTADDEQPQLVLRQRLEQNIEAKQMLCLRLEILAGVDSPEEFAQARMEYQVSRLSQSLSERDKVQTRDRVVADAKEIQEQWYLTGLLPPQQAERLEIRIERALQALRQQME